MFCFTASRVRRFLSAQAGDRRLRSSSQQPSSYRTETSRSRFDSLTRVSERHASETREIRETRQTLVDSRDSSGTWETRRESRTLKHIVERRDSAASSEQAPPTPKETAPRVQQELQAPPRLEVGQQLNLSVEFMESKTPSTITWFLNGVVSHPVSESSTTFYHILRFIKASWIRLVFLSH